MFERQLAAPAVEVWPIYTSRRVVPRRSACWCLVSHRRAWCRAQRKELGRVGR